MFYQHRHIDEEQVVFQASTVLGTTLTYVANELCTSGGIFTRLKEVDGIEFKIYDCDGCPLSPQCLRASNEWVQK